jgi:poly-gamma-glutamate capsule biosynthesis protein CapA/YwtB (metallophosphatase superfamily)
MDTNTKTPVDIIQELLAVLSTRKEAAEKLMTLTGDGELKIRLENSRVQSDKFIEPLMSELSHFGDAVQGESPRENEYQVIWQKAFQDFDNINIETAASTFEQLEAALKGHYNTLQGQSDLPESLQVLLDKQLTELK